MSLNCHVIGIYGYPFIQIDILHEGHTEVPKGIVVRDFIE